MEPNITTKPCCAAATAIRNDTQSPGPAHKRRRGWIQSIAVLPAALLPLLPSATCPFCVAAYAGVLSFFGLGFLFNERVLVPVIAVFLLVGVASVAWTTRSHREPWPLVGTGVGSGAVVAGRLVWNVPALLYVGVAVLAASALWNLWLKRPRRAALVQIGIASQGVPGLSQP